MANCFVSRLYCEHEQEGRTIYTIPVLVSGNAVIMRVDYYYCRYRREDI
jgi:hypothetical protein